MDSINFDMTTGEKSGRKLTAGTKEGRQKEIYIHLIERSRSSQVSCQCGSKADAELNDPTLCQWSGLLERLRLLQVIINGF